MDVGKAHKKKKEEARKMRRRRRSRRRRSHAECTFKCCTALKLADFSFMIF